MKKLLATCCWMCLPVVFLAAESIKETNAAVRFATVDVYVDSNHDVLAAYQLEWTGQNGSARIVGIEGGESSAFKEPPYYDAKAMQQERVILAAFSTANLAKLPRGKTRVATIHVQISGDAALEPLVKNASAAAPDGKKITVNATCLERKAGFE